VINIFIIGITGKTGAGKSTVGNYLKSYLEKAVLIDVDSLAKEIYYSNPETREEIRSCFGECVFNKDGQVDYGSLGKIVFSSRERLEKLNKIMFCRIENSIKETVRLHNRKKYVIIDAAILFNTNIYKICDFIIWVQSSRKRRQEFLRLKSGLDEEEILQRINGQSVKKIRSRIDFLLENAGSALDVQKKVKEIAEKIKFSAGLSE